MLFFNLFLDFDYLHGIVAISMPDKQDQSTIKGWRKNFEGGVLCRQACIYDEHVNDKILVFLKLIKTIFADLYTTIPRQ